MVLVIGLLALACASASGQQQRGALGWSLGGEAHVFVASDRYARDFYRTLTGSGRLSDSLARHPLVAVEPRKTHVATVLSAYGAAPALLTLARFHAKGTCGYAGLVTELVLAFPPGGTPSGSTPPSHVTVVALLDQEPFTESAPETPARLSRARTRDLVNRVAQRAESVSRGPSASLVRQLMVDADQAADAGEVVPFGSSRYAVGFRARYATADNDTLLITGVATTDLELRELRWVIRPQRQRLQGGMIKTGRPGVRYSLRGGVAGSQGSTLLLVNEVADVSAEDSRATAIDADSRRTVAAQPLALRCP